MMNVILRRPPASWRVISAALASIDVLIRQPPPLTSAAERGPFLKTLSGLGGVSSRGFHVKPGMLDFKESFTSSQAEYAAVAVDEVKAGDEGLEISKLGIAKEIVDSLANKGITRLFPIQRAVLEPAMQGRDMIGRAKTGTGKTLAFGIPILNRIIEYNAKHGRGRNPLALVLAPTRELARQVEKEFHEAAPPLDTICVYGGMPISRQMRQLDYGVDIVVGTPGRVIDLLKRGSLNLSEVQYVVLDEADQMLAVGFEEAVETILQNLPKNRQGLMFSATLPSWIKNITRKYLNNPLTVDLVGEDDQKLAEGITLYSVVSDMYSKAGIIGPLVTEHARGGKSIVFVQTKRDADRLAYALGNTIGCEALHGDISQAQRERTLTRFREGQFNVLVATDVAARGLDIPNVDLIIHYELPNSSEIFVHRSGRTGRAGKKGNVILIYSQEESRAIRGIERDVGCRFTELPKVAAEAGSADMFNSMGGRGRTGSFGQGGSRFGRSGGYGGSGFERTGGYGGSSSGGFGSFGERGAGRSGGFGEPSSGQSGRFGGSGRSGNFGGSGSQSGGFGGYGSGNSASSGRSGFFEDSAPRRPSGGFGGFGGSGRSGGSGDNRSRGMGGGFGESRSNKFNFGDDKY